jgi:HK97 family phage major capsid protein/HK97 family phage prohead protease
VLSHSDGAADLSRLNAGAPLLFNHNVDDYIGVVERAWVDGGRGYATVRFSTSERAQQIRADAQNGVLPNVSFAYRIDEMRERSGTYTATRWSPYEVSLVTVPADPTVGIGRAADGEERDVPVLPDAAAEVTALSEEPATPATAEPDNSREEQTMETAELSVVRAEAVNAERSRIADITALAERYEMRDLGETLIRNGATIDEARAAVLERMGATPKPVAADAGEIGLSDKEARGFSFQRAINALANPGDRRAWEAAAFEREVSEAAQQRTGRTAQGILIPDDILRRDLTVGTASAAGNLVATDFRPESFIELLRNRSALIGAGVTSLTGLSGNVAIPRMTGSATAYWVAESGAPTESQQTVDQINMSPKTLGAFTDYSRKLMLQSSIDVESMIRSDLAAVIALEIDRVGLYGIGAASQPLGVKNTTGINTSDFAANTPTFAEVVGLETLIAADNADIGAMRYIINASMRGALKSAPKESGQPSYIMEADQTMNGYPVTTSNQVATNDVWFGVWNQLLLGLWSGLDLTVDPYTHSTSGTIRVVALQDLDYAVRHPECFARGNNTL